MDNIPVREHVDCRGHYENWRDVTEATHVKVNGRFERIVSKHGIGPRGELAPPSKGGFYVKTETGRTVDMWHAQSYGVEE